ncbi:MAG: hypothetical protein AAF772_04310 [Acidobacteriota bacterium]
MATLDSPAERPDGVDAGNFELPQDDAPQIDESSRPSDGDSQPEGNDSRAPDTFRNDSFEDASDASDPGDGFAAPRPSASDFADDAPLQIANGLEGDPPVDESTADSASDLPTDDDSNIRYFADENGNTTRIEIDVIGRPGVDFPAPEDEAAANGGDGLDDLGDFDIDFDADSALPDFGATPGGNALTLGDGTPTLGDDVLNLGDDADPGDFGIADDVSLPSFDLSPITDTIADTAAEFTNPDGLPSEAGNFLANTTTSIGGALEFSDVLSGETPGVFQDIGQGIGLYADEVDDIGRFLGSDEFGLFGDSVGNTGAFIGGFANSDGDSLTDRLIDGAQGALVNQGTGVGNPLAAGAEAGIGLLETFTPIDVDDTFQDFLPGAAVGGATENAVDLGEAVLTGDRTHFDAQHQDNLAGENGAFEQTAAATAEAGSELFDYFTNPAPGFGDRVDSLLDDAASGDLQDGWLTDTLFGPTPDSLNDLSEGLGDGTFGPIHEAGQSVLEESNDFVDTVTAPFDAAGEFLFETAPEAVADFTNDTVIPLVTETAPEAINDVFQPIGDGLDWWFDSGSEAAAESVVNGVENVLDTGAGLVNGASDFVTDFITDPGGTAESVNNAIGEFVSPVTTPAAELFDDFVATPASNALDSLSDGVDTFTEEVWVPNVVEPLTVDIPNAINDTVDSTFDFVGDTWNSGVDAVQESWNNTRESINDIINSPIDSDVQSFFDSPVESTNDTWNTSVDLTTDLFNSTVDTVGDTWNSGVDLTTDLFNSTVDTVGDTWNSGVDFTNDLLSNPVDTLGDTWNNTTDFVGDTWNSTVDTVGDTWNNTVNGTQNFLDNAGSAIGNFFGW